jgi:hypothetical protein
LLSNLAFEPVPNSFKAPLSLDALGLLKIQFCQADNLPNIFVSHDSFPGNLRFASKPVRASGENEVLSSRLNLISSLQSKSSGITVISSNLYASSVLRSCSDKVSSSFIFFSLELKLVYSLV